MSFLYSTKTSIIINDTPMTDAYPSEVWFEM